MEKEIIEIPEPIGAFVLNQKDVPYTQTEHGAYWHYKDVLTLLKRYKYYNASTENKCNSCRYSGNGEHGCNRLMDGVLPKIDASKGTECRYRNYQHYLPFKKIDTMQLTAFQKLLALQNKFYNGGVKWNPKSGDYYTTSRADLELYQVVSVEEGKVKTKYTEGSDQISEWPESEFLTEGFGPNRVHVPDWVFKN